ncbi:kinase non-catalytic C-lobe domain-containing protein 1 [Candoia aspera]|uniref:kinase non-catalytic C-lobe domain-containing protein 1 n=1 Tax=Candoia aspera TaxID=51853 RepID=UPI002FD7D4A7
MPPTLSATGREQGGAPSLARARPKARRVCCHGRCLDRQTFAGRRREGGAASRTAGGATERRAGRDERTLSSQRKTRGRVPESVRALEVEDSVAAAAMDDFEEEESCDFDPLPALSEDEENVSLADVLSLQDSCLTEQDFWAICLECSQSLKSIVQSTIFQTLCVTPDTLAFNTNGNVCFMEQISDDPEGAFVPPEIDETGNTFEAHLYSLGATLKAALEYTMEPEADLEFSQDLYALLGQMQKENPKERPDIEAVISLCEEKLKLSSSSDICQGLSATGRKMLSIESYGTFQDSFDNMWEGKFYESISPYQECTDDNLTKNRTPSPDDLKSARNESSSGINALNDRNSDIKTMIIKKEERFCCQSISTWVTKSQERNSVIKCNKELDAKPYATGMERDTFEKHSLRKLRTFPKVPFNIETDSRTFLSFIGHNTSLTRKQYQLHSSNNEDTMLEGKSSQFDQAGSKAASLLGPNNNLGELCLSPNAFSMYPNHMTSSGDKEAVEFFPYRYAISETSGKNNVSDAADETSPGCNLLEPYCVREFCNEAAQKSSQNCLLRVNKKSSTFMAFKENGCNSSMPSSPEERHSERKDGWSEDRQYEDRDSEIRNNEQCVFLKHLLMQYSKPLKDYELWALCHECLLTLETYTDYPAHLCLDSVAINHDGSITFVPHGNGGSSDRFFLAPEATEEDFVTEKACIYCMAAILWRAARCNFPPDHKLVLPGKLKKFLLNMARSKPEDRPSLADAIKICRSYLLEQSISSKMVLEVLAKMAFQSFRGEDSFNVSWPSNFQSESCSVNANLGFLPMSNKSKLIAVKGPVPCQPPLNKERIMLPNAFTSSATHFKPIILHQNVNHKIDAIASTVVERETMPRIASVNSKSPKHSSNDTENKTDEDSDLPTTCMMPGALEHSKEGPEILQRKDPKEQSPSNTSSYIPNLPFFSESSCASQERCVLQTSPSANPNSTAPSSMTFINNFLLKQDPETRVLTLVPVQIAVSEQIPNKPLLSKTTYSCCPSLHVLLSEPAVNCDANRVLQANSSLGHVRNDKFGDVQNKCWDIKAKPDGLMPTTINKETQTKCSESNPCLVSFKKSDTDTENSFLLSDRALDISVDQNSTCSLILETSQQNKGMHNVPLENVVQLIQEEFAFGRSQDNTTEALAIGKYIFSLKDLKYNTFYNAVSEKFCDLYWEEKLLANLYDAANGKTPESERINEAQYLSKTSQSKPNNFLNGSEEAKVDLADMDASEKEVESQTVLVGMQMEGECLQINKGCSGPSVTEKEKQKEIQVKTEENTYSGSSCHSELPGFCPGWSSAFYGSEWFSLDVHNYFRKLGKQKAHGTQNIDAKKMELDQLIMIETKNYRKSITFYQRLLYKERSSKGGEMKTLLPKLERQIEEMKSKMQFLELVKKYLQIMYAEKWGVEPCNFLTVVNMGRNETLDISALDGMLLFNHINKTQSKAQYNDNQNCPRNLQAGTPLGLMAYLYSRNAFLKGYVQQFLFAFRYFCSQEELLQFLLDRIRITSPSSSLESSSLLSKIYHRSFSILQAWIEDCYTVDFTINPDFMRILKDFIISKVVPLNGCGRQLLSLLNNVASKKERTISQFCKTEEREQGVEINEAQSLPCSCRRDSTNALQKRLSWRLSKGTEAIVPQLYHKPAPEEFSGFCIRITEAPYFLTEYTAQQLCCQLTLLEQEIFHKCHPVHFLNSRLLGVKDKTVPLPKASSSDLSSTPAYNLFVKNCIQDDYLLRLLKYADNVSTWVAAEIVTSYSSKVQMNLVSKFLFIAKCCYKQRNFATAMQILRGLENLIVRQLPIWKSLPSKVSDILEELKAVEVFLKSDNLCLMEGERFKTSPTIPSAHILAMHIQQLETGGFTMRNGSYKWTKLRNIAKVVSQVQAFQENPYMSPPDCQLQDFLRQRIAFLNDADIFALAADNYANFHQKPEKQSRKIQDALQRMKVMFQ